MANINQLSAVNVNEITSADLLALYHNTNGDARKMSLSSFLTWLYTNFTAPTYTRVGITPADGFTENLQSYTTNVWLLMRPTSALNTGTIVLPLNTGAVDGQEVIVTTTYQIAALTVNKNGATAVYGAPLNLAAEDKFTLRYDSLSDSWYCVK